MKPNAIVRHHTLCRLLSLTTLLMFALLLSACETAEVRNLRIIKEAQDRRIRELQTQMDDNARTLLTDKRKTQSQIDAITTLSRQREMELKKAQNAEIKARNTLTIAEEKATAGIEAVKRQLESANSEIARLNTEMGRGQAQLESLKEEKAIIENAGDELQGELQRFSETETTLKTQLAAAQAKQKELSGVVSDLKKSLSDSEQDLKAKEKLLAQATENLAAEKAKSGSGEMKTSDLAKEKNALEKRTAELLEEIKQLKNGGATDNSGLEGAVKLLTDSLKPLRDTDYAFVSTDKRGVVLSLSVDYLFEKGSISLDKGTLVTLDKVAEIYNRFPKTYVEVQGHTDTTPVASLPFADNWSLAAARSSSVVRYLSQGKRIDPKRLKSVACAQYRPPTTMPNNLKEKMLRRVDIILSSRP